MSTARIVWHVFRIVRWKPLNMETEARENAGITQSQLASLTGVSSRMIQKYEGGISRPRLNVAEKIADLPAIKTFIESL